MYKRQGRSDAGNTLSIEDGSTLDGTWLVLENNKLVAGDGAILNRNDVEMCISDRPFPPPYRAAESTNKRHKG